MPALRFPRRFAACAPQAAEYWQLAFLALLAIVQGAVVWVGMSAGVIICVKVRLSHTVGVRASARGYTHMNARTCMCTCLVLCLNSPPIGTCNVSVLEPAKLM